MTEGWRNVRDAESTGYSCAGGRWMEGGMEGCREGGGSPGSALSSASHRKRILSALRRAAALIAGGSSTPTPPCVCSPRDITHSGDVGLAQVGDTPTSSLAVDPQPETSHGKTRSTSRLTISRFPLGVCAIY